MLVTSNRPCAARSADLKLLARLLPKLYSTQSYYHYLLLLLRCCYHCIIALQSNVKHFIHHPWLLNTTIENLPSLNVTTIYCNPLLSLLYFFCPTDMKLKNMVYHTLNGTNLMSVIQRVIITARLVVVLSSEQSQQEKSKLKIYNLNVIIVVASY